ncbi:MAG: DeoR/GlpR transcriptional regulator [Ruminococcus sp.]|nr:DeoR/GlpR transcriptional regulator [Ruminococcus sp.]
MIAQQRHAAILELLDKSGIVHSSDLVKQMNVSSETIRKDLDYLEQEGRLMRVHGGAVPAQASQAAPVVSAPEGYTAFQTRNTQHMAEKAAITKYAISLIKENQVIALDYGSTSQVMAEELKENFYSLTVITNSIKNALILADCPDFTIILTGGILARDELTLVNDFTPLLDHLHIDILFMTVTGIDPEIGCTDMRFSEARIQNQMRKAASRTVVLADSSKFGKGSLVKICTLQDVDLIITDSAVPADMETAIKEKGTELIIAQ